MSGEETCPNCGNAFVEKTKFRGGLTILTPSNEVCCYVTPTGVHMLYFHIDGGGNVEEMPRSAEEGMSEIKRTDANQGKGIPKMDS